MPGVTDPTVRPLSVHVCEITVIDQPNAGGKAAGTTINTFLINPCVFVCGLQTLCQGHVYIYAHLSDTFHTLTYFLLHYTPLHYKDLFVFISSMCVVCSCFSANKDIDKASSPHGKFCDYVNNLLTLYCIHDAFCLGMASAVLAGILL